MTLGRYNLNNLAFFAVSLPSQYIKDLHDKVCFTRT